MIHLIQRVVFVGIILGTTVTGTTILYLTIRYVVWSDWKRDRFGMGR